MSLFKTLLSHNNPHSFLRPQNIPHKPFSLFSIFEPTESPPHITENHTKRTLEHRKPLDVLFKEAVGIYPKPKSNGESEGKDEGGENELKRKLSDLEREVRILRANSSSESDGKGKGKGLYGVFTNRVRSGNNKNLMEKNREIPMVFKELSEDVKLFVSHLYKEGYMENASFLRKNEDGLDFSCFDNSFGRGFIKSAAEKFAKDNQEIAKWLSGSDLKNLALFGCPSLARKSVFAAKRMRKFFQIQEDTVCGKCILKQSCKFVNQNVWKTDTKKLILTDVLNVITLYAMDSVPQELTVPDEMKTSINRLLNKVVKLSQTTS